MIGYYIYHITYVSVTFCFGLHCGTVLHSWSEKIDFGVRFCLDYMAGRITVDSDGFPNGIQLKFHLCAPNALSLSLSRRATGVCASVQ